MSSVFDRPMFRLPVSPQRGLTPEPMFQAGGIVEALGQTTGRGLPFGIVPGQALPFEAMNQLNRRQLEQLGLPVSQAGQRFAEFRGTNVVPGGIADVIEPVPVVEGGEDAMFTGRSPLAPREQLLPEEPPFEAAGLGTRVMDLLTGPDPFLARASEMLESGQITQEQYDRITRGDRGERREVIRETLGYDPVDEPAPVRQAASPPTRGGRRRRPSGEVAEPGAVAAPGEGLPVNEEAAWWMVGRASDRLRAGEDPAAAVDEALAEGGMEPAAEPRARMDQYRQMFQEMLGTDDEGAADQRMLMLAMIGFAIASGESPNALSNIAQGLLQGTQLMREDRATRQQREDRINMLALEASLDEDSSARALQRDIQLARSRAGIETEELQRRAEMGLLSGEGGPGARDFRNPVDIRNDMFQATYETLTGQAVPHEEAVLAASAAADAALEDAMRGIVPIGGAATPSPAPSGAGALEGVPEAGAGALTPEQLEQVRALAGGS